MGIIYLILDPFKVVKTHENFFKDDSSVRVELNKDYVSTMTFINNIGLNYDSFIFGNSRSIFYEIEDWKEYIGPNAKAFHFDSNGEILYALHKKIIFLDKQANKIENVLLVLDNSTISNVKPRKGHLGIISPPLVNYSNKFEFQKAFFLGFLNPNFLYNYMNFKLFGRYKPRNNNLNDAPLDYDVSTNEIRFGYFEDLIKKNEYYTEERRKVFYKRDSIQNSYPKGIYEEQKKLFNDIKLILKKHNSDIKIIISPLYNQDKIHKEDLIYLIRLFGEENVFDFSGINKFTNDYTNYYENSHYRPHVAREILKIIYNK